MNKTHQTSGEEKCCDESSESTSEVSTCPACASKGKTVQLITLKSLLKPLALIKLNPQLNYAFCKTPDCNTVYFSGEEQYFVDDVKVTIYQKNQDRDTPVCYCFDWSEESISIAFEDNSFKEIPISIAEHIKAGRCGCEVNNPQGSCCLGNINAVIASYEAI